MSVPRILRPFGHLESDDQFTALDFTARYLFGDNDYNTTVKLMRAKKIPEPQKVLNTALQSGIVTTQLKFAMTTHTDIKANARNWDLGRASTRVISELSSTSHRAAQRSRAMYMKRSYLARTLDEYGRLQHSLDQQTNDWRERFIYSEMKFLLVGHGLTIKDVSREILVRGYRKLPLVIPRATDALHLLNSFKNVMHDQGINFLKAQVSQGRGQLIKDGDKFYGRTWSLDQLKENGVDYGAMQRPDVDHLWRALELTQSKAIQFFDYLSQWNGQMKHRTWVRQCCENTGLTLSQGEQLVKLAQSKLKLWAPGESNETFTTDQGTSRRPGQA